MKKIFKTIACCLGALAIAFTAFIVPITKKSASADEVNSVNYLNFYKSNNFFVYNASAYRYTADINSQFSTFAYTAFNYQFDYTDSSLNNFNILVTWNARIQDGLGSITNTTSFMYYPFTSNTSYVSNILQFEFAYDVVFKTQLIIVRGDGYRPSLDMKSLEYGYYSSFVNAVSSDYFANSLLANSDNTIIYSLTDTNNWKFIFTTRSGMAYDSLTGPKYDIYYKVTPDQLGDTEVYNNGFNNGYIEGFDDGESEGYSNGYNSGYNVGFGNGRNEGIQNANNYSFLGLFGAMIDAPLTGLRSLFNFEFLGINLLSFITSLLTIALITFVVKKLMGR